MTKPWQALAFATVLSAGCASSPVHYHTLVAAPGRAGGAASGPRYVVEIGPVLVPPQVDRPELVVRRSDAQTQALDNELWSAPLADELSQALSLDIQEELDHTGPAGPADDQHTVRVRVRVERFESEPGRLASIEASWDVRVGHGRIDTGMACRTVARESIDRGYEALVLGHQRAVRRLGEEIAKSVRQLLDSGRNDCRSG